MPLCRICDHYGSEREMVRYSTRHYAHYQCYAETGRPFDKLTRRQIGKFPVQILRDTGRMEEAETALHTGERR